MTRYIQIAAACVAVVFLCFVFWVDMDQRRKVNDLVEKRALLHVERQQHFYYCQGLTKDLRQALTFARGSDGLLLTPTARARYWSDVAYCVPDKASSIDPDDLIREKVEYKLGVWLELMQHAGFTAPTFETYQSSASRK